MFVGRQRRIDDLRRDVHLLDEIFCKGPSPIRSMKAKATRYSTSPSECVPPGYRYSRWRCKDSPPGLRRQIRCARASPTPDVGMDHRTVDGEILQFGPDVDQVHIGEIHPVRRIAVLQPFHAEIQPIRFQTLDLQPEIFPPPGPCPFWKVYRPPA